MRRKPICDIPRQFSQEDHSEIVREEYQFELITPMFGGDAESWKLDLKNPVRGQSVKGQLRFWWRTMQDETKPQQLLINENKIWGGTTVDSDGEEIRIKSPVSIAITDIKIPEGAIVEATMKNNFAVDDSVIPGYVLFPITSHVKQAEKNGSTSDIHFIKKMSFILHVSYPDYLETDIINTLKLWTLFGGIGARTRRGTGSIYCEDLLLDFNNEAKVLEFIRNFKDEEVTLKYPRIAGATLAVSGGQGNPNDCWHDLLKQYGKFRQQRTPPEATNRPGRSYWPEPDAIKIITKQYKADHAPNHPDGIWFPRAAFGLPIQTEFNNRDGQGDPVGKFMLEPIIDGDKEGRWPSPVILKVIKLSNGSILKVCLSLKQKFPDNIVLKNGSDIIYCLSYKELPERYSGKKINRNIPVENKTVVDYLCDYLNLKEVI